MENNLVMIKNYLFFITLFSFSNTALAHSEALHSNSMYEQMMHLLISPFHSATFAVLVVLLAFITYKMRPKTKAKKVRHNDKKLRK